MSEVQSTRLHDLGEVTMIHADKLTPADVGRNVTYHREFCIREFGKLSSWNDKVIFVRFKGPTGEACEPQDVSFDSGEEYHATR